MFSLPFRRTLTGTLQFLLFLSTLVVNLTYSILIANAQVVATYTYDAGPNGIGHLTSVSDQTGSNSYSYDQRGNVSGSVTTLDAVSYTMQYSYDSLNRVVSIKYPDNETIKNIYNNQGLLNQVQSVTNGTFYIFNIDYNAAGQPTFRSLGNWTTTLYTYNSQNLRLFSIGTDSTWPPPTGSNLQALSYQYDNAGNIKTITDNNAGTTQSFSYDNLDRLTSAVKTATTLPSQSDTYNISYNYDSIGNIICNTQFGSCSASSPNYFYPASGSGNSLPHAVIRAGSNSYSYDLNGNITPGPATTISYDFENRPINITTNGASTTFAYDGQGNRVKKTSGGASPYITYYIGKYYECVKSATSSCSKYIFQGDQRVGQVLVGSNSPLYYLSDHLGSNSVIVQDSSASQTIVQKLTYYPFGQTLTNHGSADIRYKFTGKELDNETGLYDYGARYYDPGLGRFISADTADPDRTNPQTLNHYSYSLNNPLKYTDPNGHFVFIPFLVAGASAFLWDAFHSPGVANAPAADQEIVKGPSALEHTISLGTGALIGATGGFSGVEGGLGQGVKTTAEEIIQAESPVPLSSKNLTKSEGRIFERVMTSAELKATQETGLLRGGREGINFFTNKASLDAKRAQQRLGLEGPLRDIRLQFRIKGDIEISGPRIAPGGRTGTPGGGLEFSTKELTPIEIIRIDPLLK